MRTWDAIIIGAGIIGLSLAIELRKRGMRVLVVEKGEPGREASWAAGGMLVDSPVETRTELRALAAASAKMYPEFVHELEDESGLKIDFRAIGTIVLEPAETGIEQSARYSSGARQDNALPRPLAELEPELSSDCTEQFSPSFLNERCVDPRNLLLAAIAAARHRGVDFSSGDQVLGINLSNSKACGVRTNKTQFGARAIINCAGAWAGLIEPIPLPTRPVKGQMLCVVMPHREMVRHVVRGPEVYLIPRSDGRMLIGATVEEAGFDKRTVPKTIQKLRAEAIELVPKLVEARILDAWAGLRPGTPDGLPILGATATPGYFVATGHYRDGILLAPVTAKVMGKVIAEEKLEFDLGAFGADRFDK